MKYLIGIDGGGTKADCIVTNLEGKIFYECSGGPTNFLVHNLERVNENIFNLLTQCKNSLNADFNDFESIVIGTAGAGRRSDAETLEKSFINFMDSKDIKINSFYVDSDARIALEGAFPGKPGSILISGTGSIMYGKDRRGNIFRIGGFGRYIGDQGSGYMIGRKGLIAVSKQYDNRGPATLITKLVQENFDIDNSEKLITEVYRNNFDIASVAPLVINSAQNGDPVCLNILLEEVDELLLHVISMLKKIEEPELKVSLIGGIISSDNYFTWLFKEEVKKRIYNIIIEKPEYSPAMGAVFLARERIKAQR